MRFKELDNSLKPREKLMSLGVNSLADDELLALILGSGDKDKSVIELADYLLQEGGGLRGLADLSIDSLMRFKGIGKAKACVLVSCIELVRRINYQHLKDLDVIADGQALINWLEKQIGNLNQEVLVAIFLDNKNRVKGYQEIFKGSDNEITINTKEIFQLALQKQAHSLILAHNHPSQVLTPSKQDDKTTKELVEAGKLIGIPVLDHLIIGFNECYSYKQHKVI